MNAKKQTDWLDSLAALVSFGLIITSVGMPMLLQNYGNDSSAYFIALLFTSATRFAVPLALMIAGATMLNKNYDLKTFYKKRFFAILSPALFWLIIYLITNYINMQHAIRPGIQPALQWAKSAFLFEGVSQHFWLIYMALAFYLVIPFLGRFFRKLKPNMLVFLLAAWVLICSIVKDFNIDMHSWHGNLFPKLINYFVYSGYLVLGYYFHNILYVSKNIRLSAWILYIVTIFIAIGISYFMSNMDGTLNISIYHYYGLNSMVQASALFVAFKKTKVKNEHIAKLQATISTHSYGIYLVHFMVLSLLVASVSFLSTTHPAISIPALSILTLTTSWAIIFLLRKIPFMENISG